MNDVKSKWVSVSEELPPIGRVVETMIVSPHVGDWCLIQRSFNGIHWKSIRESYREFDKPEFAPTHWHY